MPTYRVDQIPVLPLSPNLRYPLICEWCGKKLAQAGSPAEVAGLSAAAVLGLWPELRPAVENHEAACAAHQGLL